MLVAVSSRDDEPVPSTMRRLAGRRDVITLRLGRLNPAEVAMLMLVAKGLTNRQIAERLFLSRRTVDAHVAHLLDKTGAANRVELRTIATRNR